MDRAKQLQRDNLLAYGRAATKEESDVAEAFIAKHGLPAYCRVIINSNEFVYVD